MQMGLEANVMNMNGGNYEKKQSIGDATDAKQHTLNNAMRACMCLLHTTNLTHHTHGV